MKINMKYKISCICIFFAFFSTPVLAMWTSANSYVYFNAQGQVVGQSIITCNNQARQAAGVTSYYWREDSVVCGTNYVTGAGCIWQSEAPPFVTPEYDISGGVYPIGGTICSPKTTTSQQGKMMIPLSNLPSGMTVAQSCNIVTCFGPLDEFLGFWPAIWYDYTNSSIPPQLR